MTTIVSRHPGSHRRRRRWPPWRRTPPPPPDGHGLILAEAADQAGMTLAELRGFLDRADLAAWEAGVVPAGLRFRVYVRKTGHARGVSVKIGVPG